MTNEYEEVITQEDNQDSVEESPTSSQEEIELDFSDEEDVEALKEKLQKLERENATLASQKKHWRDKAENKSNSAAPSKEVKADSALSLKDQMAIMQANIDPDDLDEVLEYAQFKKISVVEAIKSPVVKNLLSEKNEQRQSAVAASSSSQRRGATKLTDDALVKKVQTGYLPESDEEIERLFNIRHGLNK